MFKINNVADLERFKASGLFSPAYCNVIEEYFLQLIESLLPPDVEAIDYSLESSNEGYFIVLQAGDNPHSLPSVGLPEGLVNSFPGPEWVETINLSDTTVYRLFYLYDNEFFALFHFDSRLWPTDTELHSFLSEQLEYNSMSDEAISERS